MQHHVAAPRFEELYEKGKAKDEKLRQVREEKLRQEKESLKFKPKINQKSKDIVKARLAQYAMQSAANLALVKPNRAGNGPNDSKTPSGSQNLFGSNFMSLVGRDLSASGGLRSVSFGDIKGHRK